MKVMGVVFNELFIILGCATCFNPKIMWSKCKWLRYFTASVSSYIYLVFIIMSMVFQKLVLVMH